VNARDALHLTFGGEALVESLGAKLGLDFLQAPQLRRPTPGALVGVPVGTLGVGPWGARNAAHLALRILALGDPALAVRLEARAAQTARGGKGR